MSYANPRYDPSRRRRGRHRHGPGSQHSPLTRLATTAAVAYGAYRLGTWAWNAYFGDGEEEDKEDENADRDLLYEWTDDYRAVERDVRKEEGFPSDYEDSPASNRGELRRSRRSRVDWCDSHDRSSSPSPPQDYHHHNSQYDDQKETAEGGEGMVKRGVKKAAAVATSGIGGAVSAGISAGIQAFNENSQPGASTRDDQERRLRMGRCRLEASRAMLDFLPTLKKAIAKETDVSVETEGLKRLRTRKREIVEMKQNGDNGDAETNNIISEEVSDEEDIIREEERRLWNDIKNKSITRLFTNAYAHTIVFLVLTVQVNLLGGRLLREEKLGESSDAMPSGADGFRASHQTVLANTYRYLFAHGIPSLVQSVGEIVRETLDKCDVLGDDVSLSEVRSWLDNIRDEMEQQQTNGGDVSPFVKFIIPLEGDGNEVGGSSDTEDELAKYILDETYDLLESPTFANAERQCLGATFDILQQRVIGKLFLSDDHIPLASVVTYLQKAGVSTFHKPPSHKEEMQSWDGVLGMMDEPLPSVPNIYISKLERLGDVLELGDVCF